MKKYKAIAWQLIFIILIFFSNFQKLKILKKKRGPKSEFSKKYDSKGRKHFNLTEGKCQEDEIRSIIITQLIFGKTALSQFRNGHNLVKIVPLIGADSSLLAILENLYNESLENRYNCNTACI